MHQITTQADNVIPMFQPDYKEKQDTNMAPQQEISLFDVKELYDAAYAAQEYGADKQENFQALIAKAVKLDMEYRQQLSKKTRFRYVSRPAEAMPQAASAEGTRVA